jgi:hypothetical protein
MRWLRSATPALSALTEAVIWPISSPSQYTCTQLTVTLSLIPKVEASITENRHIGLLTITLSRSSCIMALRARGVCPSAMAVLTRCSVKVTRPELKNMLLILHYS